MRIDGVDVLDISPASLRALFAYAPQEPFLFSDTIENNVAFAQPSASKDDIARAVEDSALAQDLGQLRDGMQTRVGERGVTLSGGQKQRVSLARALLADRPALMLDDTLSAVDPKTERRIVEGMRQRGDRRTRIVATHRLSAVADADLILVLDDGAVKERGTHHELLQLGGDYAAAWRRQTEAAALEGEGLA
jgi:ABC-type multidrug transport system fused ATPase/permease subunit